MGRGRDEQLIDAIADATRRAVTELFAAYPDDHFYYCTLITTGEGHPPALAAWSHEALRDYARREGRPASEVEWSYAESPFFCFGEQHFAEVQRLFDERVPVDDDEYDVRLDAMEAAMARLDAEGLFGIGQKRREIVVAVEVMPPEQDNTECAVRLNPLDAPLFVR